MDKNDINEINDINNNIDINNNCENIINTDINANIDNNNTVNTVKNITGNYFNYVLPLISFPEKEKEKDVWELLEEHEYYKITLDKFEMVDNLNYDELKELKENFKELQKYHFGNIKSNFGGYIYLGNFGKYIFDEEIFKINELMVLRKNPAYNIKINFNDDDEINGYKIGSIHNNFKIPINTFYEFEEIWNDNNEMSYENFEKEFNNIACSEWRKMDIYGEYYTKYWKYPENSYERENAGHLTSEENCKALFKLPYPKKFILYTVEFGCSTMLESVPFSNFMCEWMKRKIDIMSNPTLEHLCIKKLYQDNNIENIPICIREKYE